MEDLVTMIVKNENPSDIRDRIKEILYTKAYDKVEDMKPSVASKVFDED